jgi:hypothetical protein
MAAFVEFKLFIVSTLAEFRKELFRQALWNRFRDQCLWMANEKVCSLRDNFPGKKPGQSYISILQCKQLVYENRTLIRKVENV